MDSIPKILIVEDEKRLADLLKNSLEENKFEVEIAYDGYIAKRLFSSAVFNLIILDINIPLINGYELCKEIRLINSNIPIIMLTAMSSTENKLNGFNSGADDYIIKPFNFNELLARLKVFLRRTTLQSPILTDSIIKINNLIINKVTKTVSRENNVIELTAKEYSLLEYLATNKGSIISRTEIAEKIWGLNFDTGTNYIDVYINYLRRKIDKNYDVKLIHTRVGQGYLLNE
jgi:two-component system, OmpR family, copper resistance phosphate regulon response regulator CusR